MPYVPGNGFWKSWSTACALTVKFIWRNRPPHFDCWNYFRSCYSEKMQSDMSLQEVRSKRPMKQPRKFPKYLLLCLHSALELLLREKCSPISSACQVRCTLLVAFGQKKLAPWNALIGFGNREVTLKNFQIRGLVCKEILHFKICVSSS